MATARKRLIDLESTPYYHCLNRCVRRSFLCGADKYSGKNYDKRKQVIIDRMKWLTTVFGIELCTYAIMSNHYHCILYVNSELVDNLSEIEVAERWTQIYKNPIGLQFIAGEKLEPNELEALNTYLPKWRKRLKDISWYMRSLNEYVARKANDEDGCKGSFWEGRFQSKALVDEAALLACMAYVDLNPIRAKKAKTPEESNNTSIQEHIIAHKNSKRQKLDKKLKKVLKKNPQSKSKQPKFLKLFAEQNENNQPNNNPLPIERESYLELVESTGRSIKVGKRGRIPENLKPILTRLNIEPTHWITTVSNFQDIFGKVAGSITSLDEWRKQFNEVEETNTKWLKGNKVARLFYQK